MGRSQRRRGAAAGAALLAVAGIAGAGLAIVGVPAMAQVTGSAEQDAILETHGGFRVVRGVTQTLKDVADAIDGALAPSVPADDIDAIVDLDPPSRASNAYPEAGREDTADIRRLRGMTAQARTQGLHACVDGGGVLDQCERQNLLPEEAYDRQALRGRDAAVVAQRRAFEPAVQQRIRIAARDTVLLGRLERDCADNAAPGDACRMAVEEAERLGEENRALLAQPGVRAHFDQRDLSYGLVSLSRAREVRMTPGAPVGEPFIQPMFVMDRLASRCETYAAHVDRDAGGPGAVRDSFRDVLASATLADLRAVVAANRATPPANAAGRYGACLIQARMEQMDPTHRFDGPAPAAPPSGILRRDTGSAGALQAQVAQGEAWAAGRDGRAAQHRADMAATEARWRQLNEQIRQDDARRAEQQRQQAARQTERRQESGSGGEMVSTLLSVLGVVAQAHDANQRARSNSGASPSAPPAERRTGRCSSTEWGPWCVGN